jgi:PAS domain S-box-containing protein
MNHYKRMKQPLPTQNPPNILVVEDDPHSMRLLEKSLSSLDVNIIKATTAQKALEEINRHDIMLAVLDIGLTDMHGIELVKQIRAHKKRSLIPVIILTTDWGDETLIKECYASGVVDMINKPFMVDMLVAKARVFLELYAQNKQIRQQAGLIDAVGQAIIATDLNGIIWYWNRMAEEIFGWKAEEVIGKNTIDITTAQENKEEVKEIFKQLQKGKKWTGEFLLKRKDGSVFTGMVTDAPVTDQHGKLIGIIGATTDITLQKKKLEQQPVVLVVDDLESNLQLIRWVLKPLNVKTITVRSGWEALEVFKKTNIAVALIDVKMPEMSGLELVKKIRQDTRHELIPLLFITAHSNNTKNIEEYYDTGVVDLITKPFNHNVLRGKVAVFLEMYKQKQQIDRQNIALESLVKELNNSNQEIQTRLSYENLISRISKMAVSDKYTGDFFDNCLAAIGQTTKASRTYIIEFEHTTKTLKNTFEWCADGIMPARDKLQALPVSGIPWWHNSLKRGKIINYHDVEDIPEQTIKDILKAQDISSILVVPLFINGKYFGHLGFDLCYQQREWEKNDVELLVSISRIVSSVIERDKAFVELQQSAETEHALINASLDSVLLIEPDGTVVAHNKVMAEKLNLTSKKIDGRCVYDLLPGETASFRKQKVEEVMNTGNPLRFEDCRSGFYFQHSLYPVKNNAGNTYRIAIFAHDITQQKQGEIALRESEKMYRTLLSASPQGILVLDMKRMITNISDITVEIFGAAGTNEIIGRDFFSLIPDKIYGSIKSILSKTLSEGLVQNEEVTLEKRNGTPFVGEISATLIQGEDGLPKAYMVIIRDISQKKLMEQQLIRSERMVSLGEMASGMAHEINQPLLSIQFGIENLLKKIQQSDAVDPTYLKRKAESVFGDISRINHIIDHVRAFSKDHEYIHVAFDVNESINNAISIISQQFKQHEIRLELDLKKEPGLVYGNTYKLEQVILNLLSNARDAVEEKASSRHTDFQRKVNIRSSQGADIIIIEVEDNGVGIENVNYDKLYLPFFTNKDIGKGTGLGLPISFEIINDFNGTIDFDSIPGTGTIFRIQLPKA